MPTATITASGYSGQQPRAVHAGIISESVDFNSGAVSFSGASVVVFAKVPFGATILDVYERHNSGAGSCPVDIGVDGTTSAFISQGTQGTNINRATKGLPYTVTGSDDAVNRFVNVIGTFTPGTATASVSGNLTVIYTMDR